MILSVKNILIYLIISPLLGILIIIFIPTWNKILLKKTALFFSSLSFIISLFLWVLFNKSLGYFQFVYKIYWIPNLNLNCTIGIDGISLFFIILTTLLTFICLLSSWNNIKMNLKEYLLLFLLLNFFLILVFCILDLLLFYVFFESILIPMFLIIGIWGSRERKIRASFLFFFYTLSGSVIMLIAVLYIYNQVGTTDYETLLTFSFTFKEQKILWLAFFASFSIKIPMMPFHIWLPEAHVEAPTAGSVILAGILLKLGTYGFIRFSIPLFPEASLFFTPLIYALAAVGIVYTSMTAIRQTDFKKIIAYTSIAHMNLVLLGIFSFNIIGLEGAILQSLSHGFVSSALFLIIGVVYDRYHTRTIKYYSGLVHVMPLYIIIFFFFTMANIGLPGTSSFIGEFLILIGSFKVNTIITFIGATSMVFSGCYSLWLFNKIAYGNIKTQYIINFFDVNKREILIFLPLIICTLFIGIYPELILNSLHMSSNILIERLYF